MARPWKRAAGGDGRGVNVAPPFVETDGRSAAGLGETVPMETWKLERVDTAAPAATVADMFRAAVAR